MEDPFLSRLGYILKTVSNAMPSRAFACLHMLFFVVLSASSAVAVARTATLAFETQRPPVYFISNQGQLAPEVHYYETSQRHATFFVSDGLYQAIAIPAATDRATRRQAIIRLRMIGADRDVRISAEEQLDTRVNFYRGHHQSHTNIPVYSQLRYAAVYPGIDVIFHGRKDILEYDFIVAAGANPAQIQMAYEGAKYLRLDSDGALLVGLDGAEVRQQRPYIYQLIDGEKKEVAGEYRLLSAETPHSYGFRIASYDARYPLVIDPVIISSTFIAGADDDIANSVAVDNNGNVYVTGTTWSANFPSLNALKTTNEANYTDAFVSKFNASGTLIFSTYLGGSNHDEGRAIAADSLGNSYVTGLTSSENFPLSAQPYISVGDPFFEDVFITQLNSNGQILYSTYMGGSGDDFGNDIVVDESNGQLAVYVTGETWSHNFPVKNPLYTVLNTGNNGDAFVARLDLAQAGDASLVWSTYIGGSNRDASHAIDVDSAGNVYIAGLTESSDFPTTANAYPSIFSMGYSRAFIVRINQAGTLLKYAGCLGGSADDSANGIAVNDSGIAYVAGTTRSLDFPLVQPLFSVVDNENAFAAKLDTNGSGSNTLLYSTYLGGSGPDEANAIVIDNAGNAFVTGTTWSADFPVAGAASAALLSARGDKDAFVAKITNDGSLLSYSVRLGGSNEEQGKDIAIDAQADIYIVGQTRSINFPLAAPYQSTLQNGNRSGFLSRLR